MDQQNTASLHRNCSALLMQVRLPCILLAHVFLNFLSYFCALSLRFDSSLPEILPTNRLLLPALLLILFRHACYVFWDLNRGYWRHFSSRDSLTLLKAHAFSSLLFMAAVGFLRIPNFPRSVIIIEFTIALVLSGGARLFIRVLSETLFFGRKQQRTESREIIILGAGDSAHLVVNYFLSYARLPYKPVAVLDDSKRLLGTKVHGVPVIGSLSELEKALIDYPRVSAVIVAIPSFSETRFSEIQNICSNFSVTLKRVQSFEDIACIDAHTNQKGLSIEALLEKNISVEHEEGIFTALHKRRVLVTGAGGSIGSELVRQILRFKPAEIMLLDHCEYNIYKISQEIRQKRQSSSCRFTLASICNEARLYHLMNNFKPEVVFHAAAYKHVPLMEENVHEAFSNNIVGTRNVLKAAHDAGAKRFVLISSDKAVDPSCVMGWSKRIAEMLVQAYANMTSPREQMSTTIVRFGNVINSSGSVIPLFKEQILSGGPLTITHPEMRRFFMSIKEAVGLVLTAGTLGESGNCYVLDMGEEILVEDVARKMLALYGRRDIPITYTGIRPGEKLRESLTERSEELCATSFSKVNRIKKNMPSPIDVFSWVESISTKLHKLSSEEILQAIHSFVQQQPGSSLFIQKEVQLDSTSPVDQTLRASSVVLTASSPRQIQIDK